MDYRELFLGWLFGLASPQVAEWISRRKRRKELAQTVITELRELQFTLALVSFRLHRRLRSLTEDRIRVIKRIIETYQGPDEDSEGLEFTRKFFGRPLSEQLATASAAVESTVTAPLPVRYHLSFTESHVEALAVCPLEFQRRVMQVLNDLRLYNEQVEYHRSQHDRTFDASITGANHRTVLDNIERSYASIGIRIDRLLREIDDLVYALPK